MSTSELARRAAAGEVAQLCRIGMCSNGRVRQLWLTSMYAVIDHVRALLAAPMGPEPAAAGHAQPQQQQGSSPAAQGPHITPEVVRA